jgi:hypothetical protein
MIWRSGLAANHAAYNQDYFMGCFLAFLPDGWIAFCTACFPSLHLSVMPAGFLACCHAGRAWVNYFE